MQRLLEYFNIKSIEKRKCFKAIIFDGAIDIITVMLLRCHIPPPRSFILRIFRNLFYLPLAHKTILKQNICRSIIHNKLIGQFNWQTIHINYTLFTSIQYFFIRISINRHEY